MIRNIRFLQNLAVDADFTGFAISINRVSTNFNYSLDNDFIVNIGDNNLASCNVILIQMPAIQPLPV